MGRVSFTTTRRGLQPLYYGTHQIIYLAILITTCFSLLGSNLKSTFLVLLCVHLIVMTGLISFMGFYAPLVSFCATKLLKCRM